MTSRRLMLASITTLLVVLAPNTVLATHFELARLANQIELISDRLADDLRYTRYYGSVRQRAVTLRREAAQLSDSLARNRSNSRIRSRFRDVRRGYERLEQAFFTADRRRHNPALYRDIDLLSNVFASLREEFYYAGLSGQNYGPVYSAPYRGQAVIGSRNSRPGFYGLGRTGARHIGGSRQPGSRHTPSRGISGRDYGARPSGHITPSRERAIPQVFRGNTGGASPDRKPGRVGFSRGAQPADHSSNVLQRQARQNTDRRELERQAKRNRAPVSGRSSSRGTHVQRGRGGVVEGRRRSD